jgi:hypothetical protein
MANLSLSRTGCRGLRGGRSRRGSGRPPSRRARSTRTRARRCGSGSRCRRRPVQARSRGDSGVHAAALVPESGSPSRPAPQSRCRTASFPHVVDGARDADRGGERAQHSKSRSLGRRNAPITATKCRQGPGAVHAAVQAVGSEACCPRIRWCTARRCRRRGRAAAACLTRRPIRRRITSSGTCQSHKSMTMSRPCLFSREGATSPVPTGKGNRLCAAQSQSQEVGC